MNFLAHLALSGKSQNLTIGNFLGDFVKGNLLGRYDEEVELGIKFHRAIDAYTDHHLLIKLSKKRFGPKFGRIGGIMVDIAYDHLLALSWDKFHDEPIDLFSKRVLEDVLSFKELPWEAENLAKMMVRKNALEKYKEEQFLTNASLSIHKRLKNRTPMLDAPEAIKNVKEDLREDFKLFYPQLIDFSAEWLQENEQ